MARTPRVQETMLAMVSQLDPSKIVIFIDVLVHLKYASFRCSKCAK